MTEAYLASLVYTRVLELLAEVIGERLMTSLQQRVLDVAATKCSSTKPKPCKHQSKKPVKGAKFTYQQCTCQGKNIETEADERT